MVPLNLISSGDQQKLGFCKVRFLGSKINMLSICFLVPFVLKLVNRVIIIIFPEHVNLIMFNKLSTAKQKPNWFRWGNINWGFTGGASGKELTDQCRRHERHEFDPSIINIPWRRKWQPTSVFLLGEFCGQRSLEGYRRFQRVRHNWSGLACMRAGGATGKESACQFRRCKIWGFASWFG